MSYKMGDRVVVVGEVEDNGYAHGHMGKSGTVIAVVPGVKFPTRVELDDNSEPGGFPFADDELQHADSAMDFRIGSSAVVKTGTKNLHPKFNRNIVRIEALWHGAALVSNPEDDETATILLKDLAITEATR